MQACPDHIWYIAVASIATYQAVRHLQVGPGPAKAVLVEKYDIVRARVYMKPVPGRMNSYNKQAEHRDFNGYALVLGDSNSFCLVYLPNREKQLIRKENLIVVSRLKQKNKKM